MTGSHNLCASGQLRFVERRHVLNAAAFGGLTAAYAVPAMALAPLAGVAKGVVGPGMTRLAGRWASNILDACGIEVVAEDFSRPLPDPAYLVLSNHTSHFDVLAIFSQFPRDLFPVAKRELGYIPLFGWALRAGAAIMIDRRDRERAKASIEAAGEAIRGGRSVLMFPEGTRTASLGLGPFKKGPFHLALAARVPILPVAVLGASEVLAPGDWRIQSGRKITVRMGRPISTAGYVDSADGRTELADTVRAALESLIQERDPS